MITTMITVLYILLTPEPRWNCSPSGAGQLAVCEQIGENADE